MTPREQQGQPRIADHNRDQYRCRRRVAPLFCGYPRLEMRVSKGFAAARALAGKMFDQRFCAGANRRVREIGLELHDAECRANKRCAGAPARVELRHDEPAEESSSGSPYTVVMRTVSRFAVLMLGSSFPAIPCPDETSA